MLDKSLNLNYKYEATQGSIYLTGIQALVRLLLEQKQRDEAAGLNTAGFVSGYRGSPLAGLDQQLWRAGRLLTPRNIHFLPAVNEELAADTLWGTQQVPLDATATVDGVFGLWYGKSPGVDRATDALRHANHAGTTPHGGVLVLAGDDHDAKSSSLACQSEPNLIHMGMPILNPADIQEVLDFGLIGWAMSRYCGSWVSMICLADTMDSSAVVRVPGEALVLRQPALDERPADLHYSGDPSPAGMRFREELLFGPRRMAALAFALANDVNRIFYEDSPARLGIVTVGATHLHVLQALEEFGIGPDEMRHLGLRLLKVGMPWPLDGEIVRRFASGLQRVLVIENMRAVVEEQFKSILYNTEGAPRVFGKEDAEGAPLLSGTTGLGFEMTARVVAGFLPPEQRTPQSQAWLERDGARQVRLAEFTTEQRERVPMFCSGCPHNNSTKVPEGSQGMAGIGCHYMATWMDRNVSGTTQMGGEGTPWIGIAPFVADEHRFVSLGDGTYVHSGLLAIRASIAAGVNITYKLLYNDAVAMTGGQPVEGQYSPGQMLAQVLAEGVTAAVLVTDEPSHYAHKGALPAGVEVHHRDDMDFVQRQMRERPGVTLILYEQTCAAELRRRRKRGQTADPDHRVLINDAVCEGCGDCSRVSNCISVEPLETGLGIKRRINQHSCNKDLSCVKGFCPSFVTVHGGELRRPEYTAERGRELAGGLPMPPMSELEQPWDLLIAGIGGTGIVTLGALLATAAHLEGNVASTLEMIGLAQKGGAVLSHVRMARRPEQLHGPRIRAGRADALLACDLVTAVSREALTSLNPERSVAVVNSDLAPTADFVLYQEVGTGVPALLGTLERFVGDLHTFDIEGLCRRLTGEVGGVNVFLAGVAWQLGLLPISIEALERAIELNGVSVEANKDAFAWGRVTAADPDLARTEAGVEISEAMIPPQDGDLKEQTDFHADILTDYQNAAFAARYRDLVERVAASEAAVEGRSSAFAGAVMRNYFKLLARKDEYEVARLYTDGRFEEKLRRQFAGDFKVDLHLSPPLLASKDPITGLPRKMRFGPWIFTLFKVLARFKFLRGTRLDVFGYSRERRMERHLITGYEQLLEWLLLRLSADNLALAVELAELPDQIRGFGHIKAASLEQVAERERELLRDFAGENEVPSAGFLRRAA